MRTPADLMLAHVLADGTARYWGKEDERNEAITYEIAIASRPRRELGGRTEGRPFMLERYRFVRPDQVPEAAKLRTRRIIDRLPLFAAQHEHVEALCRDLAESFEYLLPGVQGAADNLEEFFSGDRGGHCEFFATALAVELRYLRIPCRLVTGYLSNEWDEESRTLTIRSRHAHAWVEVYDPKGGWYFVDPTPAGDGGGGGGLDEGLTSGIGSMLGGFWKGLVRFDGAGRDEALAMLIAFPGALVKSAIERWPLTLALPLLIVLGLRLRRRRALAGLPRAVRDYRRVLERLGLAPEPGETPRELVTRARRGSLARERLEDLQVATLAHESRRYRRG